MSAGPRLIIVCGLPGAGKTTHAKRLVTELGGIRFSPDDWMNALGINIYDEAARACIEALQWELGPDPVAARSDCRHRLGNVVESRAGHASGSGEEARGLGGASLPR